MWDKFSDSLKKLHSNAQIDKNVLTISNVQSDHQGNYECQGELNEYYAGSNERIKFAARTTLTVCKYLI